MTLTKMPLPAGADGADGRATFNETAPAAGAAGRRDLVTDWQVAAALTKAFRQGSLPTSDDAVASADTLLRAGGLAELTDAAALRYLLEQSWEIPCATVADGELDAEDRADVRFELPALHQFLDAIDAGDGDGADDRRPAEAPATVSPASANGSPRGDSSGRRFGDKMSDRIAELVARTVGIAGHPAPPALNSSDRLSAHHWVETKHILARERVAPDPFQGRLVAITDPRAYYRSLIAACQAVQLYAMGWPCCHAGDLLFGYRLPAGAELSPERLPPGPGIIWLRDAADHPDADALPRLRDLGWWIVAGGRSRDLLGADRDEKWDSALIDISPRAADGAAADRADRAFALAEDNDYYADRIDQICALAGLSRQSALPALAQRSAELLVIAEYGPDYGLPLRSTLDPAWLHLAALLVAGHPTTLPPHGIMPADPSVVPGLSTGPLPADYGGGVGGAPPGHGGGDAAPASLYAFDDGSRVPEWMEGAIAKQIYDAYAAGRLPATGYCRAGRIIAVAQLADVDPTALGRMLAYRWNIDRNVKRNSGGFDMASLYRFLERRASPHG